MTIYTHMYVFKEIDVHEYRNYDKGNIIVFFCDIANIPLRTFKFDSVMLLLLIELSKYFWQFPGTVFPINET